MLGSGVGSTAPVYAGALASGLKAPPGAADTRPMNRPLQNVVWLICAAALAAAPGCGGDSDGGSEGGSVTSAQVVDALKRQGLEAESPTPMTPQDFGLAPLLTKDATRFLIPSLGADNGGRAMIFESDDDLEKTKAYYDELGEGTAAFFSWTFANEDKGVLVQINGELPEKKAKAYEQMIDGL
jgi:hypothetical protein